MVTEERNGARVSVTEPQESAKEQVPNEESATLSFFIYEMARSVLAAFIILLLIMALFLRQVTVDGSSMNDTLVDEERLLVACFQYTPQCGDIVVVTHGKLLEEPIIKRVIAVAGQTVEIDNTTGDVIVDGVLLKEDYILGTTHTLANSVALPLVVPEGYVFVMGDNREHSLDSRSTTIDLIPVENIIGKAVFRWYPLDRFGSL